MGSLGELDLRPSIGREAIDVRQHSDEGRLHNYLYTREEGRPIEPNSVSREFRYAVVVAGLRALCVIVAQVDGIVWTDRARESDEGEEA
jgi:hypothetical protein